MVRPGRTKIRHANDESKGLSRGGGYKNRHRLRLLYIALCGAQLLVTGLGLAVAYQMQRSYSRTIAYEKVVGEKRRAIDELAVYARSTSPESLDLDNQSSGPAQLPQIQYASKIFLRKDQELLDEAEHTPNSPLALVESDLQELKAQMQMVAAQSDWPEKPGKRRMAR